MPSETGPTQALILSGGLGTRLGEVARTVPKHLMEVAGEPFAHHQLRWLAGNGVTEIVECVGHLGDEIVAALGTGERFGVRIDYISDGPELQGTGGAIATAAAAGLLQDAFFVVYGDSYLRLALDEVRSAWNDAKTSGADSLMCVYRNEGRLDTPNVRRTTDGRFEYDKRAADEVRATMEFIDYGLCVLSAGFVDARLAGRGPYDLADAMAAASEDHRMAGLEVHERFYEIGTPASLAELDTLLTAPDPRHD